MLSYPLSHAQFLGALRVEEVTFRLSHPQEHTRLGRRHGDQRKPWRLALDRDDPAGAGEPPAPRTRWRR